MLFHKVAALLLAAAVVAQDTSAEASLADTSPAAPTDAPAASESPADAPPASLDPSVTASPTASADGAAASEDAANTSWNQTYVSFPNRGENGYWVNGIENEVRWSFVIQPTYIRLENTNKTLWADHLDLEREIPGGQTSRKVNFPELPPGNHYVVTIYEEGNDKKLGVSNGFRIRPNGTAAADPGPADENSTSAQPVAGAGAAPSATQSGGDAAASGDAGASPAPTAAPSPSPTGPAQRVVAGWAGAAAAVLAGLAVVL